MKSTTLHIGALFLLLLCCAPATRAADSDDLTVSATIPSWGFCSFRSGSYTLNFGSLVPGGPDVSTGADVEFRCFGFPSVTYYVSRNNGVHGGGTPSLRMKHLTLDAYLPYNLTLNPVTGTIPTFIISPWQTLTVTGTVNSSDYLAAYAGQYADTVVLTIVP